MNKDQRYIRSTHFFFFNGSFSALNSSLNQILGDRLVNVVRFLTDPAKFIFILLFSGLLMGFNQTE